MQTSRGKLPQPDSPELDKILERIENNYLPIYEHPPSHGIQPITIQNREQAIQAIQEYYTNKFLKALPSEVKNPDKGYREGEYEWSELQYRYGYNQALADTKQAIKQLSKRGE